MQAKASTLNEDKENLVAAEKIGAICRGSKFCDRTRGHILSAILSKAKTAFKRFILNGVNL